MVGITVHSRVENQYSVRATSLESGTRWVTITVSSETDDTEITIFVSSEEKLQELLAQLRNVEVEDR